MINIHKIYEKYGYPFRKNRMDEFFKTMVSSKDLSILDVGGTINNWKLIKCDNPVVILNLTVPEDVSASGNFSFVKGDGTRLQYRDKEFDIAFSNSTIEHVGSYEDQKKFADEICRVGKRVWVETPAKSFFIEPHYLTPFIHYLPKAWQKRMLRNYSVWGRITRPSKEYIENFVDQTRLLGYEDLQRLFPGCEIKKEKFLFFTKAYVIIRNNMY